MKRDKNQSLVLWIGPASGALGWLRQRIAQQFAVTTAAALEWDELSRRLKDPAIERIIVSCPDRLGYPSDLLQRLLHEYAELPLALAVSSWWEGAGRTGIHAQSHLVLAWHRWWDGWLPWLSGEHGKWFDPCPPSFAQLATQRRLSPTSTTAWRDGAGLAFGCQPSSNWIRQQIRVNPQASGLVVANCKATAASWSLVAQHSGNTANILSQSAFMDSLSSSSKLGEYSWILWDDTSLDFTDYGREQAMICFFQTASLHFPNALRCAAISMPRWSSWKQALDNGAHELLVKPTSSGFERLLRAWKRVEPVAES